MAKADLTFESLKKRKNFKRPGGRKGGKKNSRGTYFLVCKMPKTKLMFSAVAITRITTKGGNYSK